jgi:hypothetical protein
MKCGKKEPVVLSLSHREIEIATGPANNRQQTEIEDRELIHSVIGFEFKYLHIGK